jgi:hypothetical protein
LLVNIDFGRFLPINDAPCSQNIPPSIKAFGNGYLSLVKSCDFGRGGGVECPVAAEQGPFCQRAGAGAKIGRLAAVVDLFNSVRDQAASR